MLYDQMKIPGGKMIGLRHRFIYMECSKICALGTRNGRLIFVIWLHLLLLLHQLLSRNNHNPHRRM